ncbi:hypothetical protein [Arenimonas metalli]|uniref:Uncharacterized protein n=1 Tax=Arenimonas metalli CF5-1 TaxID=1384056 RepID=A0A091B599_9GAMM|nr:hypothetical protein [Arenimonas metalli]KFN46896.1 hypothetical protein N787_00960 [Arenimonas metalli CF5-1]
MKFGLGLLLTGLVVAAAALAPAPVRADDSHDCTEGCYIITCNKEVCATWRCDDQGCRLLNTFYRNFDDITPNRAGKRSAPLAPDVAHARVCPAGKPCEVYELSVEGALHLGSFDNVGDVVKDRRAQRR